MRIQLPETNIFCESLVDLLQYRAQIEPEKILYEFLSEENSSSTITIAELAKQAQAIAATLQQRGVTSGERAILIYPPGLELISAFFACMYADVIAIPVYPPSNIKLVEKLQHILLDAEPKIILSTTKIIQQFSKLKLIKKFNRIPGLKYILKYISAKKIAMTEWDLEKIGWLATNNLNLNQTINWKKLPISSSVYLIDFLPSKLEWSDVVEVCLIALALCLVATLYPAWQAARVQPAEALRYE